MRLSEMLIILLIVGAFMIGYSGFLTDLSSVYSLNDTGFSNINQTNQVLNITNNTVTTLVEGQIDVFDVAGALITLPASVMTAAARVGFMVLQIPSYFQNIVGYMVGVSGMPEWIETIIIGIISLMLIAGILRLWGKDF